MSGEGAGVEKVQKGGGDNSCEEKPTGECSTEACLKLRH